MTRQEKPIDYFYFAYGTNLNRKQMQQRLPQSQPRFIATLPNYKLVFVGWTRQLRGGVPTIKQSRGDKVLGAIYRISEHDLRLLDKYEGYPTNYDRMRVRVFNEDGEAVDAVTYFKPGQLKESEPAKDCLTLIQQGYRDWRII